MALSAEQAVPRVVRRAGWALLGGVCLVALASCKSRREDPVPTDPKAREAYEWIQQLQHGEILERDEAAQKLAEIDHPSVIQPLVDAAHDDYQKRVRVSALRSLAKKDAHHVWEELLPLLDDSEPQVRQVTCEALGRLKAVEAMDQLVASVHDQVLFVRVAALEALGRLGEPAQERLAKLYREGSAEVKAGVVEIYGRSGERRYVDLLIRAMGDESDFLRRAAAEAAGRLGDPKAVEALARLIRAPLADSQVAAFKKRSESLPTQRDLRMVRAEMDAAVIKQGFRPSSDQQLNPQNDNVRKVFAHLVLREQANLEQMPRRVAFRALVAIGGDVATRAVMSFLADEDARIAESADETVRAMGAKAVEPLLAVLKDTTRSAPARIKAMALLGRADEERLRAAQIEALSDKDPAVRVHCAGVLAAEKVAKALEPLLRLLKAADPNVRRMAANALGSLGNPRAGDALMALLETEQEDAVRIAAATALGTMAEKRAVRKLLAMASEMGAPAQAAAVRALAAIGDRSVGKDLVKIYESIPPPSADTPPKQKPKAKPPKQKPRRQPNYAQLKRELMSAFGALKCTEALDILIPMVLERTDGNAMRILGEIGDRRGAEAIVKRLKEGPHRIKIGIDWTAKAGIPPLVQAGDPVAVPYLAFLGKTSSISTTRKEAIMALSTMKRHPQAVEALVHLLADAEVDPSTKEGAVAPALMDCGAAAVPGLVKLLKEAPAAEKRAKTDPGYYAAELLGYFGKPSLPALTQLAQTQQPKHVYGRVIGALQTIEDDGALPPLANLLANSDAVVRKWAAVALGNVPMPGAVDILRTASDDSDGEVKQWVAWALEQHRQRRQAAATKPATAPDSRRLEAILGKRR